MMSFETEEEAARSCESEVDIVEARIPERTIPATSAGIIPYLESRSEIRTMTVSDSEVPTSCGIHPAPVMPSPMTPMAIAIPIAMMTQMVATRRDRRSLLSSSMAMKRSRMCGMPK